MCPSVNPPSLAMIHRAWDMCATRSSRLRGLSLASLSLAAYGCDDEASVASIDGAIVMNGLAFDFATPAAQGAQALPDTTIIDSSRRVLPK